MPISILDLCDRAEQAYETLSGTEKALYHTFDFRIIREMEGSTHYFITDRVEHVPTIISFLKKSDGESAKYLEKMLSVFHTACGKIDAYDFEDFYCSDKWSDFEKQFDAWADAYYDLIPQRWQRINQYLESIGHDTVE